MPPKKRSGEDDEEDPPRRPSPKRMTFPLPPRIERRGAPLPRAGRAEAVAAPVGRGLPVDRMQFRKQEKGMSCSLSAILAARKAYGLPPLTETQLLEETQRQKGGTYGILHGQRGAPFSEVAHAHGMGAYRKPASKASLQHIEDSGDIPLLITSVGGGKHIMPVRRGTPQRQPGKIELMDSMRKPDQGSVYKDYDKVFGGAPFKLGLMYHRIDPADSLFGVARERGGRTPRRSPSVDPTNDALTPYPPAPSGRSVAPLRRRPGT